MISLFQTYLGFAGLSFICILIKDVGRCSVPALLLGATLTAVLWPVIIATALWVNFEEWREWE